MANRQLPDFSTLPKSGKGGKGAANSSFRTGRYSKYLPANLDRLYREALSNPELVEMADHIALLEAHMKDVLEQASNGDPVPKWSDVKELFADIETALLSSEPDKAMAGMERMHRLMDAGEKWDGTWEKVIEVMEQLRKMTDTETKRKKELHQMIPVERVVILMAAVAAAVKRNVSNPEEVVAVYKELATLHGSNEAPGNGKVRAGADTDIPASMVVVDVGGEIVDEARQARLRRKYQETISGT